MKAVYKIRPIWDYDKEQWIFSDASKSLIDEPFIGQANLVIFEMMYASNVPISSAFTLRFSEEPFAGCYSMPLKKGYEDAGGCWYYFRVYGSSYYGWLCSAIYKYYPAAPNELWFEMVP